MPLSFKIFDAKHGSFEYSGASFERAAQALYAAMDRRESGEWSDKPYMAELQRLVDAEPDFIDGHVHLAFALLGLGKPKKALEHCLRALSVGNRWIPEGFTGHIEWGDLDNRPFLRALHGAALCYSHLRRRRDAVAIMERMLALNPDDNQGIRYVLGSEHLRLGEMEKARPLLEAEAAHFPPYCYDLAMLHLQEGRWVAAATALRRGFCTNPYIAEMICGHPNPRPLAIWHDSNLVGRDVARNYLSSYGDVWFRDPYFVPFLHWVYNHPKVMAERATYLGYAEQLLWERDSQGRGDLLARLEQVREGIDDALSKEIVVKRKDGYGGQAFPWMIVYDES